MTLLQIMLVAAITLVVTVETVAVLVPWPVRRPRVDPADDLLSRGKSVRYTR